MPVRNDDANQSALQASANEEEQDAELKGIRERLTDLQAYLQKHLQRGHDSNLESLLMDVQLLLQYLKDWQSWQSLLKQVRPYLSSTDSDVSSLVIDQLDLDALERAVEVLKVVPSPTPDRQQNELPERKQWLLHQLDEWLADDSGSDEETWPELKDALEQDRLSSRSLFDE
jgi:hypothetical protein